MTPHRRHPEPAIGSARRSIAIAGSALLIVAVVGWWTRRGAPPASAGSPAAASDAGAATVPAGPARQAERGRVTPLPPPPVSPDPERGAGGLSTDDPLTAYRKANVYPPTSRPLASDQLDLLRPNQRHEVMRPADHGDGVTYLFTADRYFVIGDDTLVSTLEVRRDGKPLAVTLTQAFAEVVGATGDRHPFALAFASNGGVLTSTFAPAQLGVARQAAIGVYVEFDDGIAKQRAHFDLQYTPAAGIPARFTGALGDTIEAGSLVIHAAIDVTAPGPYVIDANLFDAADQPVAWSRFKGELAAGTHDAALVFFGKVLVDGHAHGPFHIGQLRGARFAAGLDPDLEQMPPFTGSFTTRPYPTDAFSDAEYDSADKQRMIELLGADHTHRGGAGRGAGTGPGAGPGE